MTAKVKKLALVKDQRNQAAVDLVKDVLSRLRSGESVAVGLVEVSKGRCVATAWSDCADGAYHLLNSGAARLAARLATEPDES